MNVVVLIFVNTVKDGQFVRNVVGVLFVVTINLIHNVGNVEVDHFVVIIK
jgi:hypothetical protein